MTTTPLAPRLLTREEAAAYCGVSVDTFDKWRKLNTIPGPLPGTRRWDRHAIDRALDCKSGITANGEVSAFEGWARARAAERGTDHQAEAG